MGQYRMLMSGEDSLNPVRDHITNTFYLDTDLGAFFDDDAASLAQDACNLFALAHMGSHTDQIDTWRCRVYDMSDAQPRHPIAEKTAPSPSADACGPREVAICLSFRAGPNVPRRRGRLFIGPIGRTNLDLRPSPAVRSACKDIADGLSALGGPNVQWVQHSPTTGEFHNVTDWWVDDEWDTMRSRGLRGTMRLTGTVNG